MSILRLVETLSECSGVQRIRELDVNFELADFVESGRLGHEPRLAANGGMVRCS